MTLRRNLNYHQVLQWLLCELRWKKLTLPAKLLTDGAISHARTRLGVKVFISLFQKLASFLAPTEPDFHGFMTLVFDGTTLTMPDTQSNTKHFGKPKNQQRQGAFPQTRLMALMALSGRMIIDLAFAPIAGKGTGERTLMRQILDRVSLNKALFLFDAGFYSFSLLEALYGANHNFLMKVSSTVKLTPTTFLPDGSYLALVGGVYTVRVIRIQFPGFRPFRLITSLLDPSISARELVRHYHARWDIEIGYDELKTHQSPTLRGQSPTILRSKREDLVKQEIYSLFITYNLTRHLMKDASNKHKIDPLQVSFSDTLYWIVEAVNHANNQRCRWQKQYTYLLRMISESLIDRPRRPRVAPRVIKVKSSKFSVKRTKHTSQSIDYEKLIKIIKPEENELNSHSGSNKPKRLKIA